MERFTRKIEPYSNLKRQMINTVKSYNSGYSISKLRKKTNERLLAMMPKQDRERYERLLKAERKQKENEQKTNNSSSS